MVNSSSCSEIESKVEPQTPVQVPTETRPWWVYFLYAGTDTITRVLSTRLTADGKDGQKPARGVNVSHEEGLKPSIDPEMITATTVIGQRVIGSDGKELGKIQEVAMDLVNSEVSYFVLSMGGLLGFGDKFYALPLNSLTLKPEEKIFYLNMDKKSLKRMPGFDKHNWPKKATWPSTTQDNGNQE
jgi:sporulation protein YlmC with PRC-barrel domain